MSTKDSSSKTMDPGRRNVIKTASAVAAGVGAASVLGWSRLAFAAGRPIKIGFVTPRTGPLAPFAETDAFVINQMRKLFGAGIKLGAENHPVEIVVKDSGYIMSWEEVVVW